MKAYFPFPFLSTLPYHFKIANQNLLPSVLNNMHQAFWTACAYTNFLVFFQAVPLRDRNKNWVGKYTNQVTQITVLLFF